jgi:hypothetical protein
MVPRRGADDPVVVRAGAAYGMEVQVMAGADLEKARELVSMAVGSLSEA